MTWFLDAGAVAAGFGLVSGLLVPNLIARIPEPEPGEDEPGEPGPDPREAARPEAAELADPAELAEPVEPAEPAEPKELYADIAGRPGLRWKAAVATAVVAGSMGARVGLEWDLLPLLYLAPVGVALAVVDWRTRLLPTKVIAPSYFVVIGLCLVAALLKGDWQDLRTAGFGWLVSGGTFVLLWLVYPKGMGFGDVRLSGVLGIALGYLGWGELLTGVYAGFLLGGIVGGLLSLLRIVDRKAYPFGPFMLVGALVGVLFGGAIADFYLHGA